MTFFKTNFYMHLDLYNISWAGHCQCYLQGCLTWAPSEGLTLPSDYPSCSVSWGQGVKTRSNQEPKVVVISLLTALRNPHGLPPCRGTHPGLSSPSINH